MNDANNAGTREPTTEMIDRGVAFALSVSLSGEYNWSQYIRDLYCHMAAVAPIAPVDLAVRLDEAPPVMRSLTSKEETLVRKSLRESSATLYEIPASLDEAAIRKDEREKAIHEADQFVGALWSDLFNKDMVKAAGAYFFDKWRAQIRAIAIRNGGKQP